MYRGTTPTLTFTIPISAADVAEAWVIFSQNNECLFFKELEQCSCGDKSLVVKLTQDETLKFKEGIDLEAQVRLRDKHGNAFASNIIVIRVKRILKDGVI